MDYGGLVFSVQKYHLLFNIIAVLALKCLQISVVMKFIKIPEFSTNWIAYWLTDAFSAKHTSIMERATDLISSLHDIALSQDMPFRKPQQLHSKHHSATFVLLCIPVLFTENARFQFTIEQYGFPQASSCFFLKQPGFFAEKFLAQLFVCNAV